MLYILKVFNVVFNTCIHCGMIPPVKVINLFTFCFVARTPKVSALSESQVHRTLHTVVSVCMLDLQDVLVFQLKACPFDQHLPGPCSPSPWWSLLFVSVNLTFLDYRRSWGPTGIVFLCLAYFSEHHVLSSSCCKRQDFLLLKAELVPV